jgi:deoxyribodipyrimidine photo-lyase
MGWTTKPDLDLFPAALDLDHLDLEQAKALRTWFVAHVEIVPRKPARRRQSKPPKSDTIQLSLL